MTAVDLKFCYRKRPYIVTMEMYTTAILLAFNQADQVSYRDLHDITQLPNKELLKHLQLLIDVKVLLTTVSLQWRRQRSTVARSFAGQKVVEPGHPLPLPLNP